MPNRDAQQPSPFTLTIFGASGELTRRKLIPAVFSLFRQGLLPDQFRIIGAGRTEYDPDGFRRMLGEHVDGGREGWSDFARRLTYHRLEYSEPEDYGALREKLGSPDGRGNALFYLSVPPGTIDSIIQRLGEAGLARPDPEARAWSRVVIEKPFGRDLASARDLNAHVHAVFDESQVFRIDHYLGKETVQNIHVLRFANSIFEPIWNQKYVDHVQITVSETVGIGGRGGYYEQAGALRDMVQNHLMHLLCLVAMEPPGSLAPDEIRDAKVKVLTAVRPIPHDCVSNDCVRAQYTRGAVGGEPVPGYREEEGVAADSLTETFVAFKTYIDNWRWSDVPFYIRTGKRMPARVSEISVHFKSVPRVLFNTANAYSQASRRQRPSGPLQPNILAIRIQPNEGISMRFQVKVPGPEMELEPLQMDFSYAEAFGRRPPDAYERLLLDAALGDQTLFTREDEVEAAWAFLEPILHECARREAALATYEAGTWGPREADDLIEADGRRWTILRRPRR
ncbi:MAG: glucose-6-phosphate dehydrogenase [Planctomycetota bacterium]